MEIHCRQLDKELFSLSWQEVMPALQLFVQCTTHYSHIPFSRWEAKSKSNFSYQSVKSLKYLEDGDLLKKK